MFNSILTILGSPQVQLPSGNVGANITIETAQNDRLVSNSTAIESETLNEQSPNVSRDISSSISPVKVDRNNSMSESSSSSASAYSDLNFSLSLKQNMNSINLDHPESQKMAILYLYDKMRELENLLIKSIKENQVLHNNIESLYKQNDALSSENLTLNDLITVQSEKSESLSVELDLLKKNVSAAKIAASSVAKDFEIEIKEIQEKSCKNQIQLEILNEFSEENRKIATDNKEVIEILDKDLIRVEKDVTTTNQYNRRQNLIIDGIPDNVSQDKLEMVCLDIIHRIGFLPVGSYEVVGCHRLKKREGDKTTPTIIRFVNRKVAEYCMKNRWKLKNLRSSWSLSFREDLCETNLDILEKSETLQKEGYISKVFTRNGFVKIVMNDRQRPIKIHHIKELRDLLVNE